MMHLPATHLQPLQFNHGILQHSQLLGGLRPLCG
jgi:hypothetical protein